MNGLYETILANALVVMLLGCLLLLLERWLKSRPSIRRCLWILILCKLVTPAFISVPIPVAMFTQFGNLQAHESVSPMDGVIADSTLESEFSPPTGDSDFRAVAADPSVGKTGVLHAIKAPSVESLLLSIWLLGSIACSLAMFQQYRRFSSVICEQSAYDKALTPRVRRLAIMVNLRRPPCAQVIDARISPCLFGFVRNIQLIVPKAIADSMDARSLDAILIHELMHLRFKDHWYRLFEWFVRCLFWWHPMTWVACVKIRDAEEERCDAWVRYYLSDVQWIYAGALVQCASFVSGIRNAALPVSCALGTTLSLTRRIEKLLTGNISRRVGVRGSLVLTLLAAPLLAFLPTLAAQENENGLTLAEEIQSIPMTALYNGPNTKIRVRMAESLFGFADSMIIPTPDGAQIVVGTGNRNDARIAEQRLAAIQAAVDLLDQDSRLAEYAKQLRAMRDEITQRQAGVEKSTKLFEKLRQVQSVSLERLQLLGSKINKIEKPASPPDRKQRYPALLVEVVDDADPVRVGDTINYQITLSSMGTAAVEGVTLTCSSDERMEMADETGATRISANGPIRFFLNENLAPGEKVVYNVSATATATGDTSFTASVIAQSFSAPVEKIEMTTISD